jgi:hypothetical protein
MHDMHALQQTTIVADGRCAAEHIHNMQEGGVLPAVPAESAPINSVGAQHSIQANDRRPAA